MYNPIVYLTRKETFSACHRLNSTYLTPEENLEVFGKCNHINGHGHNYVVEITVCGPINQKTGMVMNITELKQIIKDVIFSKLDHKNLDKDVEFFKNNPSTTENLAIYIWENLRKSMKKPELLHEVKINETEKNIVSYKGPFIPQHKRNHISSCTNISSDSD
ncbi:PTS family protein [Megaselia abdita]